MTKSTGKGRGGNRRTSAQIQELEESAGWQRAFGEALAYLIRNTPRPKDPAEKKMRARVLMAIRNALRLAKIRPSLAAPEAVTPPPAAIAEPETPTPAAPVVEAPAPTPIRVDFVIPDGPVPTVRPGTTAGDPFTIGQQPLDARAHLGDGESADREATGRQ